MDDASPIFPLAAGTALPLQLTLFGDDGQPLSYDDDPPPALSAEVWPGVRRAESFAVAASWIDATAGTALLSIEAAQTVGLASGRYRGRLVVQDPAFGPVEAFAWAIDVEAGPGDEPEPPSYCNFDDLRALARGWLDRLQGPDVEAGFAVERGRGREWLDDLIVGRRPAWARPRLRALLDAGGLARAGWVVEATAMKALALICEGQIDSAPDGGPWVARANRFHAQARARALNSTAEVRGSGGHVEFGILLCRDQL